MTRQFIHPDPDNEGEWITPPVATTGSGRVPPPLMTYVANEKPRSLYLPREERSIENVGVPHHMKAMSTSLSGSNSKLSLTHYSKYPAVVSAAGSQNGAHGFHTHTKWEHSFR
jgi:hypothetical protein